MLNPITRAQSEVIRTSAQQFQHCSYRYRRPDRGSRAWRRPGVDTYDRPIAAQKDEVERNIGIFHPETGPARLLKRKQHSLIARELVAEHQSACLLLWGCGDLDLESDPVSVTGCNKDVVI